MECQHEELLKLREDDHPNAADAPWPALTLARQRLAEAGKRGAWKHHRTV